MEERLETFMIFRDYIREKIVKPKDRILEFGPLTRPIVSKNKHADVYFSDVRSTTAIKKLYTSNEYLKSTGLTVDVDSIVDIDYVVKGSYRESFQGVEKFDVVILSHVIEHMPDIIFFFQDVTNLLKVGGRLVIIYPDARYCFDHFRNGSSFVDAYDAHRDSKNSSSRVFDFVNNVVHENDPAYFWNDLSQDDILPRNNFEDTLKAYDSALKNELPDDTHFWPFSDYQLVKFLYDMDRAKLLDFDIKEFYKTQENTQEFMIILTPKKVSKIDHRSYIKILTELNPLNKETIARKRIDELHSDLIALRAEYDKVNDELTGVYSSKKWKYISKLSNMRAKISYK